MKDTISYYIFTTMPLVAYFSYVIIYPLALELWCLAYGIIY